MSYFVLQLSAHMLRYLLFFTLLPFWGCSSTDSTATARDNEAFFGNKASRSDTTSPQRITMPPLPATLNFAGEAVPLDRDDVREALENELTVNTFRHASTIGVLRRIERWRPLIEKTLKSNEIPTDFIYLAVAESEFDNNAQSPAGAVGMWQFMPPTARDYGLHIDNDADMRRDPQLATEAASRYLKWSHARLKDWTLVATSYNRGLTGTQNALRDQQANNFWDLYLNPETARYLYRILAFKVILENPEAYGFFLPTAGQYQPYQFTTEKVYADLNLVSFAKARGTTYRTLRQLNPWFNNSSTYLLRIPTNSSYEIRVPEGATK